MSLLRFGSSVRNWYERPSIAFDLDGTICDDAFPDFGEPFSDVVNAMRFAVESGFWVVISTSRPHVYYEQIQAFLDGNAIPYHQIVTGKVNTDLTFDDKGLLVTGQTMRAMIEWSKERFSVESLAWLQTSNWFREQRMIPETGNLDLDVNQLNEFVVAVPVSGGLDSSTAHELAVERYGKDRVLPYYVRYGNESDHHLVEMELAAFEAVTGREPIYREIDVEVQRSDHIVHGRNAAILFKVAAELAELERWGEIWFGNLNGETPISGGDKSSRFLVILQHLLSTGGYDARVISPFQALDKPDLIALWVKWGRIDDLAKMKTCLSPTEHRCGKCQTCFRMYAALMDVPQTVDLAGDLYPDLSGLVTFAKKYQVAVERDLPLIDDQGGKVTQSYGERRNRGMVKAIERFKELEWL